MKYIVFIFLIVVSFSCKAQNIVPYDSDEDIYVPDSGAYYKDTNNVFNQFEGEWKWEDASVNSTITFIFSKKENIQDGSGYFYDLLIGEYRYVANDNELANTLSDMDNPDIADEYHKIQGIGILSKYNRPQCEECMEGERRAKVSIEHDNYPGVTGSLIMRYFVEDGVEKLHVIVRDGAWLSQDNTAPADIDIPFGEYIMVKQ